MGAHNKKIGSRQAALLMTMESLGIGFVIMPSLALVLAWRDGALALMGAGLIGALYVWFTVGTLSSEGRGLFDLSESILGRFAAAVLRWGFIIKSLLIVCFCLAVLGDTVSGAMESDAAPWAVALAMSLCLVYACVMGREIRGRLAELLLVPFFAALIFVFACGLKGGECGRLLPVLTERGLDLAKGALSLSLWFYPLEYVLTSLPYISGRKRLAESCAAAVLISGLLTAAVFAVTLMGFGGAQMRAMSYPVLEMMYSVHLPGSFIERQEGLMLGLWVVGVFFTAGGALYHSGVCAGELFKGISSSAAMGLIAAAAFVLAVILQGRANFGDRALNSLINLVLGAESLYFLALPLLIALVLLWRKK